MRMEEDFTQFEDMDRKDKFTKTEGTIYFYAPECCKGNNNVNTREIRAFLS